MNNCVFALWDEVMQGRRYLYHWSGEEEATVELILGRGNVWTLGETMGRENWKLRRESRRTLERIVRLAVRSNRSPN